MASTARIPKAEITGLYGYAMKRFSRKMFGEVPEPLGVMWHNRAVLTSVMGFGRKSQKWDQLDPDLKSFAHMAAVALVGCSFCLDLGYFQAHNEGLDEAKASEVPRWRESPVFSSLERDVMEYAEAMSETPLRVTDELSARLLEQLGQWRPEPLVTSPDVAADVELAEGLSIAMLVVLETLGPAERAVFVLHEVFETPYDEIAEAVGKSPAAVRQIAHRARDHVAARRPRMPVSTTQHEEVVDRFLAAIRHGDLQGLLNVLAPDVVAVSDGGGFVAAARRPIEGAERVAAFLIGAARSVDFETKAVWLNGSP